jgi:hypothetical protein
MTDLQIRRENDKVRMVNLYDTTMTNLIKPLVSNPIIPFVVAWLAIEQLNNHQAFGPTQSKSDSSASQLAAILAATGIIAAIVPG